MTQESAGEGARNGGGQKRKGGGGRRERERERRAYREENGNIDGITREMPLKCYFRRNIRLYSNQYLNICQINKQISENKAVIKV